MYAYDAWRASVTVESDTYDDLGANAVRTDWSKYFEGERHRRLTSEKRRVRPSQIRNRSARDEAWSVAWTTESSGGFQIDGSVRRLGDS